jgi:hypothetical protein
MAISARILFGINSIANARNKNQNTYLHDLVIIPTNPGGRFEIKY